MGNVLLVEDDIMNQRVASFFLSRLGLGVTVARGGAEALTLIQQKRFNIILMDIQMPGMDGVETTERIRALDDPYYKRIPILAFTSTAGVTVKEQAQAVGMNDFLSKPLNAEEMAFKINQYIV
ncbi:MAG TPA: response regulator [Ohtaekwangia sp.]|nr:response regulator [Ohtaekwangia sp.]